MLLTTLKNGSAYFAKKRNNSQVEFIVSVVDAIKSFWGGYSVNTCIVFRMSGQATNVFLAKINPQTIY